MAPSGVQFSKRFQLPTMLIRREDGMAMSSQSSCEERLNLTVRKATKPVEGGSLSSSSLAQPLVARNCARDAVASAAFCRV